MCVVKFIEMDEFERFRKLSNQAQEGVGDEKLVNCRGFWMKHSSSNSSTQHFK